MGIWSRVSQMVWREAEVVVEAPRDAAPREATGVPEFLRQAVRFVVAGTVATVLTAQVIGVRLVVPAEAADYSPCIQSCRVDFLIPCHRQCDRDWQVEQGDCGREHAARLRQCPGYPTFRKPAEKACQQASSQLERQCQRDNLTTKRQCDQRCENCDPSIGTFRMCIRDRCMTRIPCSAH